MMMMMSTSTLASTDCSSSSMQGSSTSSASSDVMTLTTTAASSWCAMPASTRLRLVRLVRPHQRRLLVVPPERSASYGFAVRGGKEHGIGFFVSHVEHGGEAQLKGLRIGDQILRINGYRLEDAVHKEFIQLVASQDRVTLKVRGVGMLPVKDQPDERLSWNVVKLPSVSGTPSESSFKTSNERERERERDRERERERDRERERTCDRERRNTSRDINVVLHVAPRTKLGLGICKGPEWKPGIFVQFTKERSVAREAGLRPGDQILSVNSIDFSDVLFSEAVAVMKGSTKLDMVVRTAAGCELFPGESSGYNSSASSVTGDQSPCWADAKSKRLTAVREESSQQQPQQQLQLQLPPVNKTIIKLSENGTSINNTYVQQEQQGEQSISRSTTIRRGNNSNSVVAPPPPAAPLATDNHNHNSSNSNGNVGSSSSLSSAINEELKKRKEKLQQVQQRNSQQERGASRNVAQMSHKRERNNSVAAAAPPAATSTTTTSGGGGGGDQHTALMDEFKRAHQRMFRNGFHESEHKERGETLKRTSIMPDDSCYRNNNTNNNSSSSSSYNNSNKSSNASNSGSNRMSLLNGGSNNIVNGSTELPPPPPQFANLQQKLQQQQPQQQQQQQFKLSLANGNNNSNINGSRSKPSTTTTTSPPLLSPVLRTPSILVGGLRAPATPQPDYDAAGTTTTTATTSQQQQQQRRTLRLGTVTIGEYGEQQRGKRETLRKMPSIEASGGQSNGILKNGSNRNSSNYSNNINSSSSSSNINNSSSNINGRQQQPQSQQTEKSIKFGN